MVEVLQKLIRQVQSAQDLDRDQVREAVLALVAEDVPVSVKADFLSALAHKGESAAEIAAFAEELRARAIPPPLDPQWRRDRVILDVVGTGGDRAGTFNISTTAALICAAAGVCVAKHGNRAVTSRSGSADVLEALGIPVQAEPEMAARMLQRCGFAFFFAPVYHPVFRQIAPARRLCAERGDRTVFNFLGPLLNPVRPDAQLMGVPRSELCSPMAAVLVELGVRRGMVVCGQVTDEVGTGTVSVDELLPWGRTVAVAFGLDEPGVVKPEIVPPRPVRAAPLEAIRGADANANAALIEAIFQGRERGPCREAALYNAAAALWVAGVANSMEHGWSLAERVLEEGLAARKLAELRVAARDAA
ncbi:MAG: anthranilate phosphoribosyltransferase [Verrucomicrobiota bacterium]|nr:anthranilate phosphoribosyltransferase [Limisphaera sp.]MDW8381246.1 anthranilate phosphoribosyltransferase [Verrucomicrobiota bacterium]